MHRILLAGGLLLALATAAAAQPYPVPAYPSNPSPPGFPGVPSITPLYPQGPQPYVRQYDYRYVDPYPHRGPYPPAPQPVYPYRARMVCVTYPRFGGGVCGASQWSPIGSQCWCAGPYGESLPGSVTAMR